MFERYTESARRVLFFARYEATQVGGTAFETEHLLLGLVREGKTLKGIKQFYLALEPIRAEIERRIPVRERISTSVEMPFTEETRRVLRFAGEEADRLLHNYIGPQHLLLGLLREERSVAASILTAQGLTIEDVRAQLSKLPAAEGMGWEDEREGQERMAAIQRHMDAAKRLVQELARAKPDSSEASQLVGEIFEHLNALKLFLRAR